MPAKEASDKVIRYREHRQQLTKFTEHRALAPKYSFFAEMMMLWLDAKPDAEEKMWTCLLYFMGASPKRKTGRDEYEVSEFSEESSIDRAAKEQMQNIVSHFLSEEETDETI
jgi:hypothetical protein